MAQVELEATAGSAGAAGVGWAAGAWDGWWWFCGVMGLLHVNFNDRVAANFNDELFSGRRIRKSAPHHSYSEDNEDYNFLLVVNVGISSSEGLLGRPSSLLPPLRFPLLQWFPATGSAATA
uniref:Uncharacterized protein n=1 Tax=Oryza rufipogon TaxID=4529 RepID=A0A0E0PY93_ORYRU